MKPTFGHLALHFRALTTFASAEVSPGPAMKTSEWAQKALNFIPSAKQAEVLDVDAKYLH